MIRDVLEPFIGGAAFTNSGSFLAGLAMCWPLSGRGFSGSGCSGTAMPFMADALIASRIHRSISPSRPSGSGRRPARTQSEKYTISGPIWSPSGNVVSFDLPPTVTVMARSPVWL